MNKLLPCPFCGKNPKIWQDESYGPGGPIPTDFVIECCAELRAGTEKEAIKRWNKRTPAKISLTNRKSRVQLK